MKIALLQLNPTVGDLQGNSDLIACAARKAGPDIDLAVTSELALLGYPPRDLLFNADFVQRSWDALLQLALDLDDLPPILVGLAEPNPGAVGRPLFNSAALLQEGKLVKTFRKTLLPTYDVFDEDRYFEPASEPQILRLAGTVFGISICEDIWNDRDFWKRRRYHTDPVEELVANGAQVIINLSASPFTVGKQVHREAMLSSLAKKYQIPFLYVNQVGGNDDLVFDGRSCVFDSTGGLIARGQGFEEDLVIVDLAACAGRIAKDDFTPEAEIWRALVLGTRDYVHKCSFSRVLLGLSGGIDSGLVAAVASQALGQENVLCVLMPSPYTSHESLEDAELLAHNLGVKTITISITEIMQSYDAELAGPFLGLPGRCDGREHPGPHPGQPAHGPLQQVWLHPSHNRKQIRTGGWLLHHLRRYVRGSRGHLGCSQDIRLPLSRVAELHLR